MSSSSTEEEWSWVGADGHLTSGSRDELMRSYAEGRLPARNPVKKNDWTDWISVAELVAPPTEPYNSAPSFEDTHSTRKQRTLVMRADSTASDDITVPRGIPALSPASAQQIVEIIPAPAPAPALSLAPPLAPAPARAPGPALAPAPTPVAAPFPAPAPSRSWLLIAAGGLLVLALLTVVVAFLVLFRDKMEAKAPIPTAPAPVVSAPAPAPELSSPAPSVCRANGERVRLLAIVPPGVSLHTATRTGRLVFGVPTSERGGVGMTLDPKTLTIVETTPLADSTRVAGVVPSGAGFSVDRFATRVPDSTFSLGMTPNGLSRLGDDASQSVIWEGEANLPITRPAITHVPGRGHAVAFRRGDADVRAGWIDEDGNKKTDLVRLTSEAIKSSAPSIASAGERVVVTFSSVDAENKSRIVLADLSPKLRTLPTSGENPRAPAIASVAKDRFALAWLEGTASGERSLHTRLVDAELAPVGSDETVATFARPVESVWLWQEAGRAVVFTAERAAESRNELFALRLDCR